jgi:hypothetical protein
VVRGCSRCGVSRTDLTDGRAGDAAKGIRRPVPGQHGHDRDPSFPGARDADAIRRLARLVHRNGELLFAQNGEDSIGPLLPYYDGWNREDVSATYDFARHRYVRQPSSARTTADHALRRIARAGLLTLTTDYTAEGDLGGAQAAVANSCANGALPFVSDIDLTRVPTVPARCA